jgi:hypothetical protein
LNGIHVTIHHRITCSSFNEPVQIALFEQHSNSLLICDNNSLLIIDQRTGDLLHQIDTRAFGIKTIKAFTIGLQDEIIVSDHRIHILSYEGKYIRQISAVSPQQIVDVDIHMPQQPPDLIASHHKQASSNQSHSKLSSSSTTKGGLSRISKTILGFYFYSSRILHCTLYGQEWSSLGG